MAETTTINKDFLDTIHHFKLNGKIIVATNGCFDLLHPGHIYLLERAKQLGDILIVLLNSDDSIRHLKGKQRPIDTLDIRIRKLSTLNIIDYIIVFDEDNPSTYIKSIAPNKKVKGSDYTNKTEAGREYADTIQMIPLQQGYRTTAIIQNKSCTT